MHSKRLKYRRHVSIVIFLVLLPLAAVSLTNYIVDPLQVYRKQVWADPCFWTNQRFQNAGKIKNYLSSGGYDAILLGNSVADNFRPSVIDSVLGWEKTLKLTIDGGQPSEQAFTLQYALDQGRVRHVLWVIRAGHFVGSQKEVWHRSYSMPRYLYTNFFLDDGAYLFSLDSFWFSCDILQRKGVYRKWEKDLEYLNYWQSAKHILKQVKYNSPQSIQKLKRLNRRKGCGFDVSSSSAYPAVENNLMPFVREYPDVEFLFILAPQTRQSIANRSAKYLSRYFGVQKYLVHQTRYHKNMKVFGFENDDEIVNNLSNYMDNLHYHSGVNEQILHSVAHNKNRLNVATVDDYFSEISEKICRYEVFSDFSTMLPLAQASENQALKRILDCREYEDTTNYRQLISKAGKNINAGQYDKALTLLKEVIDSKCARLSYLSKAFYLRGVVRMRSGSFDLAVSDFNRAIEINPDNALYYGERGSALFRLNKTAAAELDYRHFIKMNPESFRGYWLLGRLKSREENFDQAISLFSKAIALSPEKSQIYIDRGKVYAQNGEASKAENDFQTAGEL